MKHGAPFDPTWVLTPETDRSPFSDKRTIKARWEGEPIDNDHRLDRDIPHNAVELMVAHHKGAKAYAVTVTAWTVYTDGTMTMMPLSRDLVRLAVVDAGPRYNRKALGQVAEQYLAEFPHNLPAGSGPAETWERIVAYRSAQTAGEPVLEDALTADPVSANMPDFESAVGL